MKHIHLSDWIKENWTVGQYEPTESFKSIKNHSCVCRKADMGLIAVVGPAEDVESQKQADLFAAAPEMLEMLKDCANLLKSHHPATEEYITYRDILKLIAKAEGQL